LAKMKQLKALFLGDTKVTKAGVAQLKKALPNCKIHSNPTK
jgi:ADP-heptose:LPS heptosyltransferase